MRPLLNGSELAGCVFAEEEADLLLRTAAPKNLKIWSSGGSAESSLEQILGWAEFGGLRIAVAPGVFVPRGAPSSCSDKP